MEGELKVVYQDKGDETSTWAGSNRGSQPDIALDLGRHQLYSPEQPTTNAITHSLSHHSFASCKLGKREPGPIPMNYLSTLEMPLKIGF